MKEPKSLQDYITAYASLDNNGKKLKVAFLSSFTSKGMKEILAVKCAALGIKLDIYISDYNQYNQDILNPNSSFYKFEPDLTILFIDVISAFGDYYLNPYSFDDSKRMQFSEQKISEIADLAKELKKNSQTKMVIHNFEVPTYSPMGILESKQKYGFLDLVEDINSKMKKTFRGDNQVFVFDYNQFCSKIGKEKIIDYRMYYLADMKISMNYLPNLCDNYLNFIKPLAQLLKKCIVLDLDNTLWGGIAGEDGIDGIKLGPTPEGRSFLEFQKYLYSLMKRGIILAINSKNNPEDALKIIREHPYMILREEDFASIMINWNDKISNMKSISEELNIGLDSFVFLDDDKLNREMLRKAIPEVLVVELPEDSALYVKTLHELDEFNSFTITKEDLKKAEMYKAQSARTKLQKSATNLDDYLKALDMVAKIEKATSFTIPRITQLTQKTNQFNMTTKRYSEEEIKKFAENKDYLVCSVSVTDKFGDNGITGAVIVKKSSKEWVIDTFLLSCRIIGRGIENALLAYLIEEAKKYDIERIIGYFISTKKNIPAKEFYKQCGFKLLEDEDGIQTWEYTISRNKVDFPKFIKVIKV